MEPETSYEVMHVEGGVPVKSWTRGVQFEAEARAQLRNVAQLPFVHRFVAAMPDVHWGIGATVGSVIPTRGAVIPAAVGVDIGCGMIAVRTSLAAKDLPDSLKEVRTAIEKAVPHGRTQGRRGGRDAGAWGTPPPPVAAAWAQLAPGFERIVEKHRAIRNANHETHLGTLGTGNHFVEVCLDEADAVWFMLHSGSRGVGNKIGRYFIELAKEDMRTWFVNLPDADLAYLPEGTAHFADYVEAVEWAQSYALANRDLMMRAVVEAVSNVPGIPPFHATLEAVNCFAGETRVLTRTGVRSIAELSGSAHELLTANGLWQLAPVRAFGHQRLTKITLSRCGVTKTIHATAGHGWIISPLQRKTRIEKTTAELQPGDRLAVAFPEREHVDPTPSGIARGFVFGDGSLTSRNRARANFCGSKDKALLALFVDASIGLPPRIYERLTVVNGLPGEWKTDRPALDSSDGDLYGWLAGYFAADGDVDRTGRPTLASSDEGNLTFVRDLCTRLGIGTFGIRKRVRSGFGAPPTALYLLGLMRNDLDEKFFLIPSHRERFTSRGLVAERRAWTVVAVEETDRIDEVFCAVVEGTHAFTLEDNILTRNCHHNYVAREHHFGADVLVTRKGAVRAREGDLGIIPGSMGARSFIVRGKGNPESFHSCSHGAGRAMSRNQAFKTFTLEDHARATEGVECRKDGAVLDETPGAYKPIDAVMEAQKDLVEIVHTLRQVVCVKG
jgi:RNA-splicing ligase RtcB